MTLDFPRCHRCLFWETDIDEAEYGECTRQFFDDSKIAADEFQGIDTEADFGCVQYEPRTTLSTK
jgi:hypothetical protein